MIIKAIQFATKKHQGQIRRESGLPYVTHPIIVSELLRKFKNSKNLDSLIVAALLHDTLEDTDTDFFEIAREFSPMIAGLVLELTSDKEEINRLKSIHGKRKAKNEYLKRKMLGMSSYSLVIKLVDRLSNIMDAPTEKYKRDTVDLLDFLTKNRKLSKTQEKITAAILEIV